MIAAKPLFKYKEAICLMAMLLGGALVSGNLAGQAPTHRLTPNLEKTANSRRAIHYSPNPVSKREAEYYGVVWGVDSLSVKAVESGELIRFTYRILDPARAKIFNDKKIEAFLDSPKARARLVIPSLEKVGQLRQGTTEVAGKSYWMAFSNPRLTVKRGDRVNVVIGQFHANGLVVE
jgi:hypothetical protein